MKLQTALLSLAVVIVSQDLFASAKTDSVVTFLGGAHSKFVWMRWAWCNDNYTPKTQAAATAEGMSLTLMDTRAGSERSLVTGLKGAHTIRISRTGKWVTYIQGTTTYIVDLTAASPTKNVLMSKSDCTYWAANAMWIDPANAAEYVFCLDNAQYPTTTAGNGIYKVKLNSNGTVDRSTATKLTINGLSSGASSVDEMFSVSADGKKLGGAFPWPNTYILDIPTGRLDSRHHSGELFGCQPNIAPDNSYRFYHCQGDHLGIYMFDANMVNTDWFVDLAKNLVGVPAGSGMDFASPRWTNHVQYLTGTCPMGDNYESYCPRPFGTDGDACPMDGFWSKTADQVKQISMIKMPKFFMGKFTSDFKLLEKSILIASDPRYMQYGGDGWICSGTTDGNACTSTGSSNAARTGSVSATRIQRTGSSVTIHAGAPSVIRISDARGKVVRTWNGSGTCAIDAKDLTAGTYLVSVTAGERSSTGRLVFGR